MNTHLNVFAEHSINRKFKWQNQKSEMSFCYTFILNCADFHKICNMDVQNWQTYYRIFPFTTWGCTHILVTLILELEQKLGYFFSVPDRSYLFDSRKATGNAWCFHDIIFCTHSKLSNWIFAVSFSALRDLTCTPETSGEVSNKNLDSLTNG